MRPSAQIHIQPAFLRGALLIALLVSAGCGPKYPKCDKDDQCSSHSEVCVEGSCQQCRDDSTCGKGQQCKGGRCEAKGECSGDRDCKDNKVCRSGKCQTECASDNDCGKGLKCSDSRCVDQLSCNSNADCKGGLPCVSGRCSEAINASRGMGCAYPRVQFPYNMATLSSDAKNGLEKVADCLKEKGGTLVIEGHCDERGTEDYNLSLGEQRATAVRKYLERLGVPGDKIKTLSKGKLEPVAQGHDEASWAQNRRAEFIER